MKIIEKYLQSYAEPVSRSVLDLPVEFDNVVVIPAFDEPSIFLEQKMLARGGDNLAIVVVNAPEKGGDQEALARTVLLLEYIKKNMRQLWYDELSGLTLYRNDNCGYFLLSVDCVSVGRRLPEKEGVGLARKIGADIAVNLIFNGVIKSHTINSTDADVQIPDGYFAAVGKTRSEYAGYTFPFTHSPEHGFDLAMQLYEFSLRYYVAGLEFAGSKYAFHTIGSCLAFSAESYAKVRGFPKRAAGEDFYLLNKLAKVGDIKELAKPVITVAGRGSGRVPFGTGPALTKIANMESPLKSYEFYNPMVFDCLREFLQRLPDFWQGGENALIGPQNYGEYRKEIDLALRSIGFTKVLSRLRGHAKSKQQFLRACHDWFDAFKTLKFIHFLRGEFFPSVVIAELRGCSLVSGLERLYPELFAALYNDDLAVQ
ncbi:MAG: hypothetical protein D6B28_09630 [Gammaproteobacteria bacterium]|nr:MAG: hypothetical protein D6B28_09630 [Gammaproteobacteria bacterium]